MGRYWNGGGLPRMDGWLFQVEGVQREGVEEEVVVEEVWLLLVTGPLSRE